MNRERNFKRSLDEGGRRLSERGPQAHPRASGDALEPHHAPKSDATRRGGGNDPSRLPSLVSQARILGGIGGYGRGEDSAKPGSGARISEGVDGGGIDD